MPTQAALTTAYLLYSDEKKDITMTTVTSTEQADPYRYGWRYILHPLPNGE